MRSKGNEYFMRLCLELAKKAKGRTLPNPMVGAVVVKGANIVGRGYHHKAGLSHAEVIALDEAGQAARGACLYVSLEPCSHFGKTPPCVDKIIKSGVKKVIIGMADPNPINSQKGVEILRKHNIEVEVGFLENELRRLNEVFIKYITKKMPFVTLKVAQSLDGKIATRSFDSKWITSDKSRAYAHRLRKNYDAIMVGVNTVLRDDPNLITWFSNKHPKKIIVDSQLSIHETAKIFEKGGEVILATLKVKPGQETENRKILGLKAKILDIKEKDGQINLRDMMKKLAQLEISNIIVEGGGTLSGSLFDEGLVDKVMFFVSSKIIGGKDAISSVMGRGVSQVDKSFKLNDIKLRRIGSDFLVEGYVQRNS